MGEYGIPAISDREDDYIQNPEVETLLALLKIIDNPLQDLALTAVLRSVFVGLDEEDLSRLRLAQKAAGAEHIWPVLGNADHILKPGGAGLVSSFLSLYKEWRLQAVKDGAAPLIRKIIADTDYLTYVSGLSGGEFRKAHVLAFYQLALSRDSGARSGLYSFLTELSRLTKDGRNFRAKTPSVSAADAVRIMTIHRSKGLEFPVVFLVDAAKNSTSATRRQRPSATRTGESASSTMTKRPMHAGPASTGIPSAPLPKGKAKPKKRASSTSP